MRFGLKRAFVILLGIITGPHLFAQSIDSLRERYAISSSDYRTWSVGVSGGISTPYVLVGYNSRQDFTSPDLQWGYGFYVKDQLSHGFGLEADLFMGKLKGDHSQERFSNGGFIYNTFETKVNWAASLSGNFTIAHIYNKKHQGIVQPYLSLGLGVVNYTPTLFPYHQGANSLATSSGILFPVGAGFKFNITRSVNLDFGYTVQFAGDDRLDGYTYGPTMDRFSYTHLGLEFVLGKSSRPQMVRTSRMAEMQARERRAISLQNSVWTELDREKAKNVKLSNDIAATNTALERYHTDSDGDGVPDFMDKCPNTPAGTKVDGSGCPLPEVKSAAPVVTERPKLTVDDWRIVTTTMRNLEFYPGTAVISETSFPDLNKLVKLVTDKKQSLKVEVYTGNSGRSEADLKLSKERAEAIKGYLANRGVDPATIQVFGYGNAKPVASNKTVSGRKINERVILTLF